MQDATQGRGTDEGVPPRRSGRREDGAGITARLHVLVVDDEPLIGTTLRILLDEHEVRVVGSGPAARDLLAGGASFDVILCDLMLEGFSGMDLSRWLETERPEMAKRLVFMTGGAFTEEARSFLRGVPSARQLEKPFSTEDILRVLRSV
ncbi:MAG: response regulator [Sandaracinaceae bacterium]|nr:response regulator [Sandaracinaceae bacterium]